MFKVVQFVDLSGLEAAARWVKWRTLNGGTCYSGDLSYWCAVLSERA